MTDASRLVEAIAQDNRSGASLLVRRAARAVGAFVGAERSRSAAGFEKRLASFSLALLAAQPSMAPIINLVDSLWRAWEGGPGGATGRRSVAATCRAFIGLLEEATEAAARRAAALIPRRARVLTYSASSTVLRALLLAGPKRIEVLCSEGRPILEGVAMAERLARAGIRIRLMIDAALPGRVAEAGLLLLGADAILPGRVVNKVGTRTLAAAARDEGVPRYVVGDSTKLLAPSLTAWFGVPERDPREVVKAPPAGVIVENRYFDETPLAMFSGAILEDGVVVPRALLARLRARPASRALARRVLRGLARGGPEGRGDSP